MEQTTVLAESSVVLNSTGVAKNSTGPCNVLGLSSYLEKRSVVENNVGVAEGKPVRSARRNAFPKPTRKKHAATTLGNTLHGASGLMGTALKAKIRELEGEHDIPEKYRLQWLQDQLHASTNPRDKLACQTAIKRIQRSGSKGRYPVFYNIEGLIATAFPVEQS